jgi:hypothetical protein
LRGSLLQPLVFNEKDIILNVFDNWFELIVFKGLFLNCKSEFLDGVFQGLKIELILTFQLNVKDSSNWDFHLMRIHWNKLIIFGGEGFFDFVKRQEGIGFEGCTKWGGLEMGLDEEVVVFGSKSECKERLSLH